MPTHIAPHIQLDATAEREALRLLEEVLGQPTGEREVWLNTKLVERAAIGQRVRRLLVIAERYGF